ncbi:hypothetical protein [Streptomyces sp. NPDC101234]|uniref:hypothetical protein n=1 Tax=Streptomyces sp. NPDC101234 TaxID=3366138 RepID=UPI003814F781
MSSTEHCAPTPARNAVREYAFRARWGFAALTRASDAEIDTMSLATAAGPLGARNRQMAVIWEELQLTESGGMSSAPQERLRLTEPRLQGMTAELRTPVSVQNDPRGWSFHLGSDLNGPDLVLPTIAPSTDRRTKPCASS